MKIAAVADLHNHLPEVPDCDVLILAGDYIAMEFDNGYRERQLWLNLGKWLTELVERGIVPIAVAGNHDFAIAEKRLPASMPWILLEDSSAMFGGLKFYGTPWQPWYGGWAYNAPEFDGEDFLDEKFQKIPEDTDVLITHTPPAGFFDRIGNRNVGSISLNKHVQRVCPTLHVFGHIHQFGVEQVEGVTLCNAAVTTVKRDSKGGYYEPTHNPIPVFEI